MTLPFHSVKPVARFLLAAALFANRTEFLCHAQIAAVEPGEELSGGETTVFDASRNAFTFSDRNLPSKHRTAFFVGNSFFNENWVAATASVSSRDGLGPLFVTRSCSACHFKDGRGGPPAPGSIADAMVFRISIPGTNFDGGPKPDPIYGAQLQTRSLPQVKPEADVIASYEIVSGNYADGEAYSLRRPTYAITNLGYGPLCSNIMISALVAPSMIGLGLLEAVPEETLRQLSGTNNARGDGISGKLNIVRDTASGKLAIGRFGWKAEQPNVAQQCAVAFNGDMGLTTELITNENYTAAESACAALPSGGNPEVSPDIFAAIVMYSQTLAVPARRDWTNATVLRGKELFHQLNCVACHVPKLETGERPDLPELSRQTIRPYTDLLLHDMGEGLADHRPVFQASGSEWRTAPLWGIGLVNTVNSHTFFLHDGRARNFEEAILWHGGEAEKAKERFRQLEKKDRDALVSFLQSL